MPFIFSLAFESVKNIKVNADYICYLLYLLFANSSITNNTCILQSKL